MGNEMHKVPFACSAVRAVQRETNLFIFINKHLNAILRKKPKVTNNNTKYQNSNYQNSSHAY